MNTTIDSTISTLNDLIETLKDGQHGFKAAAEDVKNPELKAVFEKYSTQRAEFIAELQARVIGLGADVEKSGSVAGALHRGWMNLKSSMSSHEAHAILAECERGEDSAVKAYREALEKADIDEPTRQIFTRQYLAIQSAHDDIKRLRDSDTYRKR
jgi:uncharacterized protein (TIGR02284 family)